MLILFFPTKLASINYFGKLVRKTTLEVNGYMKTTLIIMIPALIIVFALYAGYYLPLLLVLPKLNLYSDVLEIFLYMYENAETNW